jgi:hypothetical protein
MCIVHNVTTATRLFSPKSPACLGLFSQSDDPHTPILRKVRGCFAASTPIHGSTKAQAVSKEESEQSSDGGDDDDGE